MCWILQPWFCLHWFSSHFHCNTESFCPVPLELASCLMVIHVMFCYGRIGVWGRLGSGLGNRVSFKLIVSAKLISSTNFNCNLGIILLLLPYCSILLWFCYDLSGWMDESPSIQVLHQQIRGRGWSLSVLTALGPKLWKTCWHNIEHSLIKYFWEST